MVILFVERKTNIGFKNMTESEGYVNAIDIDYDDEDVTFFGYVYKINTPQFKNVKRSAYAKSINYMEKVVECRGQNCYVSTSGMCFIKSINFFTDKDYTEELGDFIGNEKDRPGVMTSVEFDLFVKIMTSTLVALMEREQIPETLEKERHHCSYIIIITV